MEGKASQKVPGGKLIRVSVEWEDSTLSNVKITGDFFMHPEEAIVKIEEALSGFSLENLDALEEKIQEILDLHKVTLVGVTAADMAGVIKQALTS